MLSKKELWEIANRNYDEVDDYIMESVYSLLADLRNLQAAYDRLCMQLEANVKHEPEKCYSQCAWLKQKRACG